MKAKQFEGSQLMLTADGCLKVVLGPDSTVQMYPCGCDPREHRHSAVWLVEVDPDFSSDHVTRLGVFCTREHADHWVSVHLMELVPTDAVPSQEVISVLEERASLVTEKWLEQLLDSDTGNNPDEPPPL
jgi:hypothetical protein